MSIVILPLALFSPCNILSGMKAREASKIAKELGSRGGKARAKNLTPEQRQEIARKAVQTRWAKAKRGENAQDSGEN